MLNICIGDADTLITNQLVKEFNEKNVFCKGLTQNGTELINLILNHNPHAVLLDLMLLEVDGFTVIEEVRRLGYNGVIIVHTAITTSVLLRQALATGADYILLKPSDVDLIINRINMLIDLKIESNRYINSVSHQTNSSNSDLINAKVCNLIKKIGISPNLKGYKYVRDAIIEYLSVKEYLDMPISEIYKKLAQLYNTKPMCVERNIRNAIEIAWIRGDVSTINSVFGYSVHADKGKPTNSEFIAMIADKIKLDA